MSLVVSTNANVDPDFVPDPVWVVGAEGTAEPKTLPMHHHRKDQLVFNARGMVRCQTQENNWIVPPQCAVWIPAGTAHQSSCGGNIENYVLYVEPSRVKTLPRACCIVSVCPMLQEMLRRAAQLATTAHGPQRRLADVILDEVGAAPVEQLRLPMPHNARLRQIVERLIADPADKATLSEWAQRVGLGQRTLSRLLLEETGMTFGRWRRQLHVLVGIRDLTAGETVQTVASNLGYESASSYTTMFRKTLGRPPGRYIAERPFNASAIS